MNFRIQRRIDKIIEIAAVKLTPENEVKLFHKLINPLIPIPEHTIQYHQLTNDKLKDSPSLKKPLQEFIDFYGNYPLLAHSAMFDASFLIKGIHDYNYSISLSSIYDSCRMARAVYKKKSLTPKDFKLSTLAEFFNISFDHHKALDDALVALKVFAHCLIEFEKTYPKENLKNFAYLFKLNSFLNAEKYILPNKLAGLKEATQKQHKIDIKYKGGRLKNQFRTVKPISLLPLPQGLILYAECLNSQQNKYFHVNKIQSLKLHN